MEQSETSKNNKGYASMSKAELVVELEKLVEQSVETVKEEVAYVKSAFYALHKAEQEAATTAETEETAEVPAEKPADTLEEKLKELLNKFKERRLQYNAEVEAEQRANLDAKLRIIEQISAAAQESESVNKAFDEVRRLQQEFKEIGEVPEVNATAVWKDYNKAVERFYDLLKIDKELRDYDFKKNLEVKEELCAEAEALVADENVLETYRKMQDLFAQWKTVGPVAKELRDEIWARFNDARTVVFKRHQEFFEARKAQEQANEDGKNKILEAMSQIATDLTSFADWDKATKAVLDLQEEWKKFGATSRKTNNALWIAFRKQCDEFFEKKSEYFKETKATMTANYEKKVALCEKAEALKTSQEWKKTTDALVELQKEWKTVGPVAKKLSDDVWARFNAACDYFFEQKKQLSNNVHKEEHANLKAKKQVIAALKALNAAEEVPADAVAQVKALMKQWQEIGHVPYKEKDKVYGDYKAALDEAYEKFDVKQVRSNLNNFESSISQMGSNDRLMRERERLVRDYERKCGELKTYQNNLGFFNATSKSGNSMLKEMERRMEKIQEDIAMLEQKIRMIDEKL